jgi:polar amino acid transport system substrate-binding protein
MGAAVPRLAAIALAVSLAVAAVAYGGDHSVASNAGAGAAITKAEVPNPLRFGTDPTYPPLEYIQGGKITGAEVEIMHEAAKRLGTRAVFVRVNFAAILTGLQAGRFDAIAAGAFDNIQRHKDYLFIEYLGHPGFGGLFRDGEAPPNNRATHLCGKTLAVGRGTGSDESLKALTKNCSPAAKLLVMPSEAAAQLAVRSGRAYGFFTGHMAVANIAKTAGGGRIFDAVQYPKPKRTANFLISVMVRDDDEELARELQRALQEVINSGRYGQILKKYGIDFMALKKVLVNRKP